MDIKTLTTFLKLTETCHFGVTAKQTHMTPSTLSRLIQRLEDELNTTLFMRDSRSVKLTPDGEKLKLFAQEVLSLYRRFQQDLHQNPNELSGELKVFCSVTAAYSHLPTILDQFRIIHPLVEINLTTGDAADAVIKLNEGLADIAIAGKPHKLPSSIVFHPLGEIKMGLFIPKLQTHFSEKLHQHQPHWNDIPFILPEHGPSRQRIDSWFKENGIKDPKIYATVSGHEAIVSMIALGCGVAFLPTVVVENSPDIMRQRISEWSTSFVSSFEIGVCVQKRRLEENLINGFWNTLHTQNSA